MKKKALALTAMVMMAAGAGSAARAATLYSNDFSSGLDGVTAQDSMITTSPSGEKFLELTDYGSSATLDLNTSSYIGQPLTLAFTIDVVGSMDGDAQNGGGSGDAFTVTSGPSSLFNYTFANYGGGNTQSYPVAGSAPASGASGTNTLGYSGFPDSGNGIQDSIYNITLALTPTASTTDLTFTSLANEGPGNEFYGVDNLSVTGEAGPVSAAPEPSTWVLLFAGIGGIGLVLRSAKKVPGFRFKDCLASQTS
jgi:hypothetical protein